MRSVFSGNRAITGSGSPGDMFPASTRAPAGAAAGAAAAEPPADAECCYAVRLFLENPTQEQTVRFVVLGLDPVWVMRHEDYMMTLHWDMKMMQDQKPAVKK